MAIYLSCPPLIHTSLFLNAKSYTPSWSYSIATGFMEFEFMTEPSYRLAGIPPPSKSNSSIFEPEAVIKRIKEGANLMA